MGISQSVFLGPYVECDYRDEVRDEKVFGCTKPNCEEYAKRARLYGPKPTKKFCSSCGSPTGETLKPTKYRPTHYDVLEQYEDNLTPLGDKGEGFYLGPNLIEGPTRRVFLRDEHHENLATMNPSAEIVWFCEEYAEELVALREAYNNVVVRWGVHVHYS